MSHQFTILVCAAFVVCGCAADPQNVRITTIPAGASITVGQDYIGEAPVEHHIPNLGHVSTLSIEAVNACYRKQTKVVRKKSSGYFPDHVLLKLDGLANPPASCGPNPPSGSSGTQGSGHNITVIK